MCGRKSSSPSRPVMLFEAAALFAGVTATLAASAGESRIGAYTFSVPDGFTVELAAGPPLVDRPITASFDEDGRLYVGDSSGLSERADKQLELKPHRILRLEDLDGDGRFDRRIVFADRMMFPEGTLWFDGSLYVAAVPSIWKLTDTDGDGTADLREEWFQGKTVTGCANDLHGPYLGRDGWLYWCKGAFAEQTHERPGRPPLVTRAAHIFRRHPDGGPVEPVMTGGMDNPVDVVFLDSGERIFTTTFLQHPGGGRRDGLIHAIYGGVYGKDHDVLDGHPRTGTGSEELMPVLTHFGAAAPCGLAAYESAAFGEEYRGNLFAALFNLRKVTRHVLRPHGATFASEDSDFLVCDSRDFHPTDVIEDADGSLLVVDTGGWYKICCPTSQLQKSDVLGAVYRVRRTSGAAAGPEGPPADPRGRRIDWQTRDLDALAALLGDARPEVRQRAIEELALRGSKSIAALRRVVEAGESVLARNSAVWTLARIDGAEARAANRLALADSSDTVRHAATHVAGLWRDREAVPPLLELLRRGSAPLRRSAAEAVGRIGDPAAVPALLAAFSPEIDRVLEHSLTYALIEIADSRATAAAGLNASGSSARLVQRAALLALDQMRFLRPPDRASGGDLDSKTLARFLNAEDPKLRGTAWWIASRRPEWGEDLAGLLASRLAAIESAEKGDAGELGDLLAGLSASPSVQELVAETALDRAGPRASRLLALDAMRRAALKEAPASWVAAIVRVAAGDDDSDDADEAILRAAVHAAGALKISAPRAGDLSAALLEVARDASRPADLRLAALEAAPEGLSLEEPLLLDLVLEHLASSKPLAARTAAAAALAKAKLGPREQRALVARLGDVGPLEIGRAFAAFEGVTDEKLGLEVLDGLAASPGFAGLRPDALRKWLEKAPAAAASRGRELLAALEPGRDEQRSALESLLRKLPQGDVRRGQEVFNSEKAACFTCHAIGYLGGNLGPDLTRIGQIRSETDLLESLLYPSASFVQSWEPTLVVTTRGEAHNGVMRKDAPDEVVLVTGATTQVAIPRAEIAEIRPGTTSIMPAGLTESLSAQQIADLLAFLKATRW